MPTPKKKKVHPRLKTSHQKSLPSNIVKRVMLIRNLLKNPKKKSQQRNQDRETASQRRIRQMAMPRSTVSRRKAKLTVKSQSRKRNQERKRKINNKMKVMISQNIDSKVQKTKTRKKRKMKPKIPREITRRLRRRRRKRREILFTRTQWISKKRRSSSLSGRNTDSVNGERVLARPS